MEEKYVPNYKCRDCKNYGRHNNYCTKRVDHIKTEVAAPWFVSTPFGEQIPCCEFEPSSIHKYDLENYWATWENWWEDYLEEYFPYYPKETPENKFVWFTINGDKSIRYGIAMMDYIYGKMYATKKQYYKKVKTDFGYKLITEDIEGVNL